MIQRAFLLALHAFARPELVVPEWHGGMARVRIEQRGESPEQAAGQRDQHRQVKGPRMPAERLRKGP
jgi:hypothetical protein